MYIYWLRSVEEPDKVIDFYGDHLYELGSKVFAFNEWWIVEDYAPNNNIAAWEDEEEFTWYDPYEDDDFFDNDYEYAEAWWDEDEF